MGERERGREVGRQGGRQRGKQKGWRREVGSDVGGSYRPPREPFPASSNPVLLPLHGAKKTKGIETEECCCKRVAGKRNESQEGICY